MELVDVGLEAIILSHLNREKVVVVLLVLLAGGVLSEECLVTSSKLWRECGSKE